MLDLLAAQASPGAASGNRRRWQVAAVPCVLPERCDAAAGERTPAAASPIAFPPEKGYFDAPEHREARYLWRWVSMLGPDLVIEVRRGDTLEWRANALAAGRVAASTPAAPDSLAGALGTGAPSGLAPVAALQVSGPPARSSRAVRALLDGRPHAAPSPMRRVSSPTARRARRSTSRAMLAGDVSGVADHELHPGAVVERRAAGLGAHRRSAVSRPRGGADARRSCPARSRPSPSRTC